jgi:putative radical SAM enzyme (TIGR03279 family)
LGLRPGDRLKAINGHVLRDVIDYRFYGAEERLELEIKRDGARLSISGERRYGEEFGLRFAEDLFDGLRHCANRCEFCFLDQMPPGLRASLYVKDDDYRYSFLHGNFITLTNWREEDWTRVAEQRLSPLYISVHSTDDGLRRELLCNPEAPAILPQLQRLSAAGIDMHTQIVVISGKNDGTRLERTARDLVSLHPAVKSVGVVPVGLTRYHRGNVRLLSHDEEQRILELVDSLQEENLRRVGSRVVYAADEIYLRLDRAVPLAGAYEGFPQLENGIGLVRQLLDEWQRLWERGFRTRGPRRGTAVCGTLISSILGDIVQQLEAESGLNVQMKVVANQFFGPTVTVSGLLTARDVLAALEGEDLGEVVFLPRSMFDSEGVRTLDGASVQEMHRRLRVPVHPIAGLEQITQALG